LYYAGNPTRQTPRLQLSKPREKSFGESFLDETEADAKMINSLMIDSSRNPVDLIQEDFPSTPSTVYSNRLLANAEGRFDGEDSMLPRSNSKLYQNVNSTSTSRIVTGLSTNSALKTHSEVEHATISMNNLYVVRIL